jgi:glycosyltransferase involved in cell wall biosynthesis
MIKQNEDRTADPGDAGSLPTFSALFVDHAGNVSDKWEHYLAIYDFELARFRDAGTPVKLLEIGVQNGGSLQVFAKYLPEGSRLVGLDVDPTCENLSLGPNIQVAIANAADPDSLNTALADERFNIIIDDGSHRSEEVITTFRTCFDRLEPGGLYIVEDLHASYLATHGGSFRGRHTSIEYLKALVDALNIDHVEGDPVAELCGAELGWLREAGEQLARIAFYDSIAVLEKLPETKRGPYRRILAGCDAPVSGPASQLTNMPAHQLRNLVLPPATAASFGSALLGAVAAAREDVGRLRAEASAVQSKADSTIHGLLTAQTDANQKLADTEERRAAAEERRAAAEQGIAVVQSQADAIIHGLLAARVEAERSLAEAEEYRAELGQRVARLEERCVAADARVTEMTMRLRTHEQISAELTAIRVSTAWRATEPVRRMAGRLPPSVRQTMRRFAKVGWWTLDGQLPTRVRAWRQLRSRRVSIPLPASGEPAEAADQAPEAVAESYETWYAAQQPSRTQLALQRGIAASLAVQPRFSVLVPVFLTPPDIFMAMVSSVEMQTYENWELCLAVVDRDAETKELVDTARRIADKEPRIRLTILPENFGIAGNSNVALEMATGDWAALLDHDDVLSPEALYRLAEAINANRQADFLYSDKDMVDRDGIRHYAPLLKPNWSPDAMLNSNYLTHLCAIRMERMRAIGGWNSETDGAQDWDLFLRAIGTDGNVVHVPHVLYHWRHIETSVSSGGLGVKPFAAAGQLRTLKRFLPVAGWPGATPRFEGLSLRIVWDAEQRPSISVVVVGGPPADYHRMAVELGATEVISANSHDLAESVDKAIADSRGDTIVLVDAGFVPTAAEWLDELALPLQNRAIALVAGKVMDSSGKILDYGVHVQDDAAYPAFRGAHEYSSGPSGASIWYRNTVAAAGGAVGFRRAAWEGVGGFAAHKFAGRADLAFALEITRRRLGRIMINPFARFRALNGPCAFEARASVPLSTETIRAALPNGDPYLNPHLDATVSKGPPTLRPFKDKASALAIVKYTDFEAEARAIASSYDITSSQIAASVADTMAKSAGPLRRVCWFIPGFEVPFYGGIHTILRAASYMRSRHFVVPTFAVLGGPQLDAATVRSRIAQAFPELSDVAVHMLSSPKASLDLEGIDAAVATFWTTAYALLEQRGVRRKFYFVQDWEPLFYPAGTTSSLTEATYRFGFHGVCNTPALAESYRSLGGLADYFLPSVDPTVFHSRGRKSRRREDPFSLFCYIRPGTPRNGFESVAEALRLLKARYGDGLEVISAGADWSPKAYGLDGILENLGLLPYASTGALYRVADAGLIMMATRHPSYLPLELLACGAAVVTNRNPYTAWLLRDGENCALCEMARSDIADTVGRLIDDPSLRERIVVGAQSDIASHYSDWDASCERIFTIMREVAERPVG